MGWYSRTVAAGSTVRITVAKKAQKDFDTNADFLREDHSQHSWTHTELVSGKSKVKLAKEGDTLNGVLYVYWARPSSTSVTIEILDGAGTVEDSWEDKLAASKAGAYSIVPFWVDAR